MPGVTPISNYRVFDYSESKQQDLYDNEGIFDRFDLKVSQANNNIMTGGYNDSFSVIDPERNSNTTMIANFD